MVQDLFGRTNGEVLPNPTYSMDLSLCDFIVFGPQKKLLKGGRVGQDVKVEFVVRDLSARILSAQNPQPLNLCLLNDPRITSIIYIQIEHIITLQYGALKYRQ